MGFCDTWNVTDFCIALANNNVIAGGAVSGNLTFKVTKPMTFRSVTIKIVGKENAHTSVTYTTGHGKDARSHTSYYNGYSNVHKQRVSILGGLKGSQFTGELPVGEYNFPFAFILPANAPPSIPMVGYAPRNSVDLSWHIKATIEVPFNCSDSNIVAPFFVATAMPISQYNSRHPFVSAPHSAPRTCLCCFDAGFTVSQLSLNHNMFIFGRDKTLDGCISINNEASEENTSTVTFCVNRVGWGVAGTREGTFSNTLAEIRLNTAMKAGDPEKRFDFSIPLDNDPALVSCYRGNILFYYYQLRVTCDSATLFTVNLIASNALDESDRSLPLNVTTPGPIVQKGEYPMYIYAPPPGVQPTLPQVPSGFFPPPTGSVQPMRYPAAAPPPPSLAPPTTTTTTLQSATLS